VARWLWVLTAINGFLAVALGAFGAHGLKRYLAEAVDVGERLGWWSTAAEYQLAHALALGFAAHLYQRVGMTGGIAGLCFQAGVLLFSGSLYAMTLTNIRWLGAITPFGGLSLLAGWAFLAIAGFRIVE
jgi:uncharacterized membrane protein YgdD (TMEM256/DUF423 family)